MAETLMDASVERELIEAAKRGMGNAYAPVTRFPVGASILTVRGTIYQGCNTESVISGMGVCAERSAIDHAVACGEYCFRAVAVVSQREEPLAPCGMCLQYIGEFSQVVDSDIEIIMVGAGDVVKRSTIRTMAHAIFGPVDLGLDVSKYRS
jgi:cytidine deaminase